MAKTEKTLFAVGRYTTPCRRDIPAVCVISTLTFRMDQGQMQIRRQQVHTYGTCNLMAMSRNVDADDLAWTKVECKYSN